jgi:hypothetical protein
MTREQHGGGPAHYSCQTGGLVLELYPHAAEGDAGRAPGETVMLGFSVASLDEALGLLREAGAAVRSPARETGRGGARSCSTRTDALWSWWSVCRGGTPSSINVDQDLVEAAQRRPEAGQLERARVESPGDSIAPLPGESRYAHALRQALDITRAAAQRRCRRPAANRRGPAFAPTPHT